MYIAHYSLFSKHIETLANTEDERRLRLSATENTGSHANMHTNPQAISLVREETSYIKGSAITLPQQTGRLLESHVSTRGQTEIGTYPYDNKDVLSLWEPNTSRATQ